VVRAVQDVRADLRRRGGEARRHHLRQGRHRGPARARRRVRDPRHSHADGLPRRRAALRAGGRAARRRARGDHRPGAEARHGSGPQGDRRGRGEGEGGAESVSDGIGLAILSALATHLPLFICWGVLVAVAVARWDKHPNVSLMAVLAVGGMFLLSIVGTAFSFTMPMRMHEMGVSASGMGVYFAIYGVV